jgi:hypothetical protein
MIITKKKKSMKQNWRQGKEILFEAIKLFYIVVKSEISKKLLNPS